MGFQNNRWLKFLSCLRQYGNLLLAFFIFITFAWDWEGDDSAISGFRIYKISKANPAQVEILQDNIPATVRQTRVYVPDDEAWKVTFVATTWKDELESDYSNQVGLAPRTPEQIELVPDAPTGIGIEGP